MIHARVAVEKMETVRNTLYGEYVNRFLNYAEERIDDSACAGYSSVVFIYDFGVLPVTRDYGLLYQIVKDKVEGLGYSIRIETAGRPSGSAKMSLSW